jgi:hypothetical protein
MRTSTRERRLTSLNEIVASSSRAVERRPGVMCSSASNTGARLTINCLTERQLELDFIERIVAPLRQSS